jgi:hypothetical protein
MEKTIRSSVAMGDSTIVSPVNTILAFRSQIPGVVAPEIQSKITNLRGIIDSKALSSARNGGDWRRGPGQGGGFPSSGMDSRWRGSNNSMHSPRNGMMRNPSANSLSSGTSTPTPKTPSAVYTGPPLGRYQSRFKSATEDIEEKILNRIIRLKLNKFGPTTYTEIRDFLYQILGQESVATEDDGTVKPEEGQVAEFVCDFMQMVFKKAAAEEIYCPLYAKLLSEIGAKHSCIFEEMNRLYTNYMEIFEEADVNKTSGDMAAYEKKVTEKKYRQGYSQFIAELTALEILSLESLCATFQKLLGNIDKFGRIAENKPLIEEYVDCILRMSRVLKDKHAEFFVTARNKLFAQNKSIIDNLINIRDATYPSLSPKARFLLMDIRDILCV